MVRQIPRLNGDLKQTLGDSGGQRSQACDGSWGRKGSDVTQQQNNHNNSTPSKIAPRAGKGAEQLELSYTAGENAK